MDLVARLDNTGKMFQIVHDQRKERSLADEVRERVGYKVFDGKFMLGVVVQILAYCDRKPGNLLMGQGHFHAESYLNLPHVGAKFVKSVAVTSEIFEQWGQRDSQYEEGLTGTELEHLYRSCYTARDLVQKGLF